MRTRYWVAVVAVAALGTVMAVRTWGADPSAEEMVQQIKNLKEPALDESKIHDEKYIASYMEQEEKWEQAQSDLIQKLYARYPENADAQQLMTERWIRLAQEGKGDVVMEETGKELAGAKDARRADLLYVRAVAGVAKPDGDARPGVDAFLAAAPKDERGADLLLQLGRRETDQAKQEAIYREITEKYPDAMAGRMAKGKLAQLQGVGKPFDLEFTDAISGKPISVQKDLKGKVVVIDFWATWCGPCVAEMPANKELYEKYHSQGVEFIGVSLDQPAPEGLTALKDFVAKNGIPWPQDHLGKGWDSDFSTSWGIDSIPTMFVVDKEGKLASVAARGKLETLIPQLLAK